MNKEQIKHWADVLKEIAVAQFVFFGGKNIYLYAKTSAFEWLTISMSIFAYLLIHGVIHDILGKVD